MFIMKNFYFLSLVLLVLVSCNSETAKPKATQATPKPAVVTAPPPQAPPTFRSPNAPNEQGEPAQNAQGVWHYTCPNGHEGGAGNALPCSKCGTTLVHNQAYHANANNTAATAATPSSPQVGQSIPLDLGAAAGAPAATTNIPEPPQNADGVWHYTCPNGVNFYLTAHCNFLRTRRTKNRDNR